MNALLQDWEALHNGIQDLTEEECKILLEEEKKNGNRLSFLLRIYGRYNKLRCRRERAELAAGSIV